MRTIINRRPTNNCPDADQFNFGDEIIPLENIEVDPFNDHHQEGYIGFYDEEGE